MSPKCGASAVMVLGLIAAVAYGSSCDSAPCGALLPIESGAYVISEFAYGKLDSDDEWLRQALPGAQLTIDRDNDISIIRYTRDGTTYEVRHTLRWP